MKIEIELTNEEAAFIFQLQDEYKNVKTNGDFIGFNFGLTYCNGIKANRLFQILNKLEIQETKSGGE